MWIVRIMSLERIFGDVCGMGIFGPLPRLRTSAAVWQYGSAASFDVRSETYGSNKVTPGKFCRKFKL